MIIKVRAGDIGSDYGQVTLYHLIEKFLLVTLRNRRGVSELTWQRALNARLVHLVVLNELKTATAQRNEGVRLIFDENEHNDPGFQSRHGLTRSKKIYSRSNCRASQSGRRDRDLRMAAGSAETSGPRGPGAR